MLPYLKRPFTFTPPNTNILLGPVYEITFDSLDKAFDDPAMLAKSIAQYAFNATGPLTISIADFLDWERIPENAHLSNATQALLDSCPDDKPHIDCFLAAGLLATLPSNGPISSRSGNSMLRF